MPPRRRPTRKVCMETKIKDFLCRVAFFAADGMGETKLVEFAKQADALLLEVARKPTKPVSGGHTPGPWRWEFNRKNKSIQLVGGVPTFDKTVMDFERWGMGGACPRFNEKIAGNEFNIMTRVSDHPDWIAPFDGRTHHADWCADVMHPDARLIAAAPMLLDAAISAYELLKVIHDETGKVGTQLHAAIIAANIGDHVQVQAELVKGGTPC